MGNVNSTRWKGHKKRRTVESCKRVNAREAPHVGAETTTTPIANTSARRLWCLCQCGRRVSYLYEVPDEEAGSWKCRTCHRLTNHKAQAKGTRAAFEAWLTPARWQRISRKHPATTRLYEQMHALYLEQVAPFDLDKMTDARRTELLETYASEAVIRRVFDQQRAAWSAQIEPMVEAAGAQIRADIWEMWKRRNRPQKKF